MFIRRRRRSRRRAGLGRGTHAAPHGALRSSMSSRSRGCRRPKDGAVSQTGTFRPNLLGVGPNRPDQIGATCGITNDACTGDINCGSCPTGQHCVNGQCAPCRPVTCAQLGVTCGTASAAGERSVAAPVRRREPEGGDSEAGGDVRETAKRCLVGLFASEPETVDEAMPYVRMQRRNRTPVAERG
jgi:hypothetical protein